MSDTDHPFADLLGESVLIAMPGGAFDGRSGTVSKVGYTDNDSMSEPEYHVALNGEQMTLIYSKRSSVCVVSDEPEALAHLRSLLEILDGYSLINLQTGEAEQVESAGKFLSGVGV